MIEKKLLEKIDMIKSNLVNDNDDLQSSEIIEFITLITECEKYKDVYIDGMENKFNQDGLASLSFEECITYFHWLLSTENEEIGTISKQIEKGRFIIVINLFRNYLSDKIWINGSKIFSGLIGFTIGDVMGVPTEFSIREKLFKNPVKDMIGYGSHDVPAGSWSDDSSMTFALIDSINQNASLDYTDICNKFVNWVQNAEYTPTGEVFDIGRTCLRAIRNFSTGKSPTESGLNDYNSNGNGSLMRILPLAYYIYYRNIESEGEIIKLVNDISSLTHAHEISRLGCYIYIKYVLYLLSGYDKYEAYNLIKRIDYSSYSNESLEKYKRILIEDISKYSIDEINSTGYVVDTLEASLWMTLNTNSYKESIIGAINLGNDTDTIGAICGSLTGIIYGLNEIPTKWINALQKKEYIFDLLNKFETILCNSKKDAVLGAIIGDIVGSRFEHNNCKNKQFTLFRNGCRITDDSIMTLAVAKALTESNGKYEILKQIAIDNMVEVGRKYQECGFGRTFYDWIKGEEHKPYNSYGNGAAMRISPVGVIAKTEEEVKQIAINITEVSHNHPDGIKGAEAVAMMIFLIKEGLNKDELKEIFIKDYYPINFTVKELINDYKFKISCSETVPQAFQAFYESLNFEDAIRNAVAIGGDSDTIGAICGSMAAMYYGIPEYIEKESYKYLDDYLSDIYRKFCVRNN